MAEIFVSYTGNDRDWSFWLAAELKQLGHSPYIHEWEIQGGAWETVAGDLPSNYSCERGMGVMGTAL